MIRISMTRDRGSEHFDQGTREEQPMSALRTLVQPNSLSAAKSPRPPARD